MVTDAGSILLVACRVAVHSEGRLHVGRIFRVYAVEIIQVYLEKHTHC